MVTMASRTSSATITSPTRVIVIGAGWSGLAAAKTYCQINPSVSLTVLDEDSTVGGVWSASRIYPGLIADSTAAIFDFSDLSMPEDLGVPKWADLPAEKVHEYLEHYIDKFDLRRRCKLNTKVLKIERDEALTDGAIWKVEVEVRKEFEEYTATEVLLCDKLIVATGATSTPNLPENLDWKEYVGPVFHSKDMGQKRTQLTADGVKRVTVVGGSKSSIDAVYHCALAGKEVDWIIREDGYGPILAFQAHTHGISAGAIKAMRFVSTITGPGIMSTDGFWYKFLYSGKSKIGTKFLKKMLDNASKSSIKGMYGKNENTMKLAPDLKQIAWGNSGVTILHDNKFMELVAEGKLIHIHRNTLTSFQQKAVTLKDGTILPSDATVFATGWKTSQSFIFPPSLLPDLGLPFNITDEDPALAAHWETLDQVSEKRVKDLFPMLASLPKEVQEYDKAHFRPQAVTPFRIFRHIMSPTLCARGQRDLVVLGTILNPCVPTYSEVSSLWGVAYLENLPFAPPTASILASLDKMEKEVSLITAWNWLVFRNRSQVYLDGTLDIFDHIDVLMRDLGLEPMRKKLAAKKKGQLFGVRGMVKEWFWPYRGLDYDGLVDEYLERWRLTREEK